MPKLVFKEIENGTHHSNVKQFLDECEAFERSPRRKYALKYAEIFGLDPWPFWEIAKQVIEDRMD